MNLVKSKKFFQNTPFSSRLRDTADEFFAGSPATQTNIPPVLSDVGTTRSGITGMLTSRVLTYIIIYYIYFSVRYRNFAQQFAMTKHFTHGKEI